MNIKQLSEVLDYTSRNPRCKNKTVASVVLSKPLKMVHQYNQDLVCNNKLLVRINYTDESFDTFAMVCTDGGEVNVWRF